MVEIYFSVHTYFFFCWLGVLVWVDLVLRALAIIHDCTTDASFSLNQFQRKINVGNSITTQL